MKRPRFELYRSFLDFISAETQRERSVVNRRMLSVFVWCFLLPTVISFTILLLVKLNVLPLRARGYTDWLVLVFPVIYSLYFLGSEVLRDIPTAFRRGGMGTTLGQALKEGEWRHRTCDAIRKSIPASSEEWRWIISNFKMDLAVMRYRTRYLTALAGAVFFLIMQGIDSIAEEPDQQKVTWMKDSVLGWIETSSGDMSQFIGLGLFLVLLYLSGSQTSHSLHRYLNCAELLAVENEPS